MLICVYVVVRLVTPIMVFASVVHISICNKVEVRVDRLELD